MTHPVTKLIHATYQNIASWPTERLHELMEGGEIMHPTHDLLRCVVLMELLFRLESHPDMPPLVWQLVFSDILVPPEGLMSPSESHPHLRRWVRH